MVDSSRNPAEARAVEGVFGMLELEQGHNDQALAHFTKADPESACDLLLHSRCSGAEGRPGRGGPVVLEGRHLESERPGLCRGARESAGQEVVDGPTRSRPEERGEGALLHGSCGRLPSVRGPSSNFPARDTSCFRIGSAAVRSRSQMAKTASAKALSAIGGCASTSHPRLQPAVVRYPTQDALLPGLRRAEIGDELVQQLSVRRRQVRAERLPWICSAERSRTSLSTNCFSKSPATRSW